MFAKILQFIKFSIVGASNTLVSLAIYYMLIALRIPYLMASVAGYIVSTITGYFLNRIWVFQQRKGKLVKSLFRYYVVYISSLFINMICLYFLVNCMGISEKTAPILILFVTIPYNFLLSKFWVYKEGKHGTNCSQSVG